MAVVAVAVVVEGVVAVVAVDVVDVVGAAVGAGLAVLVEVSLCSIGSKIRIARAPPRPAPLLSPFLCPSLFPTPLTRVYLVPAVAAATITVGKATAGVDNDILFASPHSETRSKLVSL